MELSRSLHVFVPFHFPLILESHARAPVSKFYYEKHWNTAKRLANNAMLII
jgi:hypothetical protein